MTCLLRTSAACVALAVSVSGVSGDSGGSTVALGAYGPFKASIKETASYPAGIFSQLP